MKTLFTGYRYEVANASQGGAQIIQFVHREPTTGALPELATIVDGTTTEELLAVVIHQMKFENKRLPCRETSLAITKLEESLMWLQQRTADRQLLSEKYPVL